MKGVFERKIIVLLGADNKLGHAICTGIVDEGARVVIVGCNEFFLNELAMSTGAIPVVLKYFDKTSIEQLTNTTICRFGKIDILISLMETKETGTPLFSDEKSEIQRHKILMSQLYAVQYILPQMSRRGKGHFIYSVYEQGLHNEYLSPFRYSTITNPILGFAERMRARYKDHGVDLSLLCIPNQTAANMQYSIILKALVETIEHKTFIATPDFSGMEHAIEINAMPKYINVRKSKRAA